MAGGDSGAAYQTIPCLIKIWLLIEHHDGEGNQKIPQPQEVKRVKKPEAE